MSVERRLYEALRTGHGIRLSFNELQDLVLTDDAIMTRLSNVAAREAGVEEPGCVSAGLLSRKLPTWSELGNVWTGVS